MRVHINAGGRQVEIECGDANVTPESIAAQALAVWERTAGATPPSDGPASGGPVSLGFGASRPASTSMRRPNGVPQ